MLHRTDERWLIWREIMKTQHPAATAGTVQGEGRSIVVWGMFSWHSLSSLIIEEGTMDQYKCASAIADHVHPYMCIVSPQDDGIYQQDSAKIIQIAVPDLENTRMRLPFSPGRGLSRVVYIMNP
ncbi:transposable element Tcb1 transposase [Trichonephila clavipes]|nr:transposable element Tcb1 transposase [Trichonephila clavipes]